MHSVPVGAPRQELGIRPIRVLRGGSFPPQAADAPATTTSASEPASKSERGPRSTRSNVQRGRDDTLGHPHAQASSGTTTAGEGTFMFPRNPLMEAAGIEPASAAAPAERLQA